MAENVAENTGNQLESVNTAVITVSQPKKLEGLLDTINLINTVSERIGEDRSGDLGSSGGGSGQQGDDDDDGQSWRDQAIANLPTAPVMQKQLQKHIKKEIKSLRKDIVKASINISQPGAAYKVNQLYARLRRLKGVLNEMFESSIEVIQRLYVRIFVDKQPVF